MFTPRSYAVHAPALSLPEAAMLPALEHALPRNLLMPDRRMYHPMPVEKPVANVRRGSMAGRAVLKMMQPKQKGRA